MGSFAPENTSLPLICALESGTAAKEIISREHILSNGVHAEIHSCVIQFDDPANKIIETASEGQASEVRAALTPIRIHRFHWLRRLSHSSRVGDLKLVFLMPGSDIR